MSGAVPESVPWDGVCEIVYVKEVPSKLDPDRVMLFAVPLGVLTTLLWGTAGMLEGGVTASILTVAGAE